MTLGWERLPHHYGSFFKSAILKVPLQLCSKFLLNNYEAHWQKKKYFERHPIIECFTDMDQNNF